MKWEGLITDASPHDLPAGAAQVQTNAQCLRPGRLDVRAGYREVWFENVAARGTAATDVTTLPDLICCAGFKRAEADWIVFLDEEGGVHAGRSPV